MFIKNQLELATCRNKMKVQSMFFYSLQVLNIVVKVRIAISPCSAI